jgi:hypothetical protein
VTDTAPPAAVQIARDAMRPRFGYITSEEVRPALDALAHAGWLRPPHPKHPELPEPTETERMGWDMAQRRVGERDAALAEVERLRHHLAWAADRLRVAGLAIDAKVLTDIAALDAAPGRTRRCTCRHGGGAVSGYVLAVTLWFVASPPAAVVIGRMIRQGDR